MIHLMLALLRFHGPEPLLALLDAALAALAEQAGFVDGAVGRSPDDPEDWLLTSRWHDAGALRRGLGAWDAKLALGPLQQFATGADGVFELLARRSDTGGSVAASDRAADADHTGPRR